jgi:hypothetical protein
MSYIFLLDLGEESSADSFSAIPASVLLSGMPTRGAFYSLDSGMGHYRGSQSGMMSRRLTARRGAGAWMLLRAASRVRTYRRLGRAQALTGNDRECGGTWPASLARYDRDSRSWKTVQCSLLGGSASYSEIWPRWGTMRNGVCWELPTPERRTDGSESGFLPWIGTPTASISIRSDEFAKNRHPTPAEFVRMWPTPVADGDRRTNYAQGGTSLGFAVRMWPTPTAQDAKNNGAPSQMERNTKPLNAEVGGALNPTWVEWLMGWPLGWTDCAVSATDKYRRWRRLHGKR